VDCDVCEEQGYGNLDARQELIIEEAADIST
jgi:hypothetical protein